MQAGHKEINAVRRLRLRSIAMPLAGAAIGCALIIVNASEPSSALPTDAPSPRGLIWDGDASQSKTATFGIDNCPSPGSITAVNDAGRGKVWQFSKPAGDNRCEAHGIKVDGNMYKFQNNATYYISWSSRLSSLADNNAVFQWKSYGDHIQNYPVVLKMIDGRLTLLQRQPGGVTALPWDAPVTAGSWNTIVLGIHTSSELTGGWVELYFNGVRQTFSNNATRWPCRTWDSRNDPKWGVYGGRDNAITNDVDGLRIGTTLADVS
jgi:hypothetical protein